MIVSQKVVFSSLIIGNLDHIYALEGLNRILKEYLGVTFSKETRGQKERFLGSQIRAIMIDVYNHIQKLKQPKPLSISIGIRKCNQI